MKALLYSSLLVSIASCKAECMLTLKYGCQTRVTGAYVCTCTSCPAVAQACLLLSTGDCWPQEADKEIRELLAWMRQEEGSDEDEEADMLMALAQQAGPTPQSESQRSSQQVPTAYSCFTQLLVRRL